jgi:hypothetical protein
MLQEISHFLYGHPAPAASTLDIPAVFFSKMKKETTESFYFPLHAFILSVVNSFYIY